MLDPEFVAQLRAKPNPSHNDRVLLLLADGQQHTHHELYDLHVIAHSRVAALRKRGYDIWAWREGAEYRYQLVGAPQAVAA